MGRVQKKNETPSSVPVSDVQYDNMLSLDRLRAGRNLQILSSGILDCKMWKSWNCYEL